jgi:hypothetical protein
MADHPLLAALRARDEAERALIEAVKATCRPGAPIAWIEAGRLCRGTVIGVGAYGYVHVSVRDRGVTGTRWLDPRWIALALEAADG